MTNSIIADIMILIVLVLAVLIYRAIYKRRINRVLNGEIRDVHTSMPSFGSFAGVVLIIALFALLIRANNKITELLETVDNMKTELSRNIYSVSAEVSDIQELIEAEDDILQSFEYEFGNIDTEKHTVMFAFECVLKEYNESTVVTLQYMNEEIQFEKQGVYFVGQIELPLFEAIDYGSCFVSALTDDVIKTEEVTYVPYGILINECVPNIYAGDDLGFDYSKGKLNVIGNVHVSFEPELSDVRFVTYVNGKEIESVEITSDVIEIDKTYNFDESDELHYYIEATYLNAYKVKVPCCGWENESYIVYDGMFESVSDMDGNVLYGE